MDYGICTKSSEYSGVKCSGISGSLYGSSSLLVKISYFVLIKKIVMIKNWLIFNSNLH